MGNHPSRQAAATNAAPEHDESDAADSPSAKRCKPKDFVADSPNAKRVKPVESDTAARADSRY